MLSIALIRRECRATLKLAIPLMAGQLSQMLLGLADTLMIGRVGTIELAAVAFANSILHLPLMFGIGLVMAVSVRVSQARGAQNPAGARSALRNGLYLSLGLGALIILGSAGLLPLLDQFRQDPGVIAVVPDYFMLLAASMGPALMAMAIKNHADAMSRPWPALWIMFGGVILNIGLNALLIFGQWGLPAMGLEGAGLATLLARITTLVALLAWCLHTAPDYREWLPQRWLRGPEWSTLQDLLKIGTPTGLHLLAEVGAFVLATLMVGALGAVALASHQIAISMAAFVFMVPMGLGMALTVRVGEAWGAQRHSELPGIFLTGWGLMALFASSSVLALTLFNREIAALFTTESAVLDLAAGLLLIAGIFHFSDALQIVSTSLLRGLDDVRVPAAMVFGVYWLIALPLGGLLTFGWGWGAPGIWWGLTLGLTLAGVALSWRAFQKGMLPIRPQAPLPPPASKQTIKSPLGM